MLVIVKTGKREGSVIVIVIAINYIAYYIHVHFTHQYEHPIRLGTPYYKCKCKSLVLLVQLYYYYYYYYYILC